jgi:pilus assembly protein Flp/PilA
MDKLLSMIAFVTARISVARDEAHDRGATATEYAMLVAFIAVAIAAAVTAFGKDLSKFFSSLAKNIGIG